jgi:cytochrome P450
VTLDLRRARLDPDGICIGEHFAWMEGRLLLAALARRWRLRLVPDHPIAIALR